MPSWFKKVFKNGSGRPTSSQRSFEGPSTAVEEAPSTEAQAELEYEVSGAFDANQALSGDGEEAAPDRRVIDAPVIMAEDECSSWSDDIRIRAQVDADGVSCVFLVDRPVLDGFSLWLPEASRAEELSPLGEALFAVEGVGAVLMHGTNVTVHQAYKSGRLWEDLGKEAGRVIREHLKGDKPVVSEAFLEGMLTEEDIRKRVQACIDLEINPGIAAHSGVVVLERVLGNTVFITMGGGCQGCAASAITLRQGIHAAFRQAVAQVGAICDETDHAAGTNPYFKELPAGMGD